MAWSASWYRLVPGDWTLDPMNYSQTTRSPVRECMFLDCVSFFLELTYVIVYQNTWCFTSLLPFIWRQVKWPRWSLQGTHPGMSKDCVQVILCNTGVMSRFPIMLKVVIPDDWHGACPSHNSTSSHCWPLLHQRSKGLSCYVMSLLMRHSLLVNFFPAVTENGSFLCPRWCWFTLPLIWNAVLWTMLASVFCISVYMKHLLSCYNACITCKWYGHTPKLRLIILHAAVNDRILTHCSLQVQVNVFRISP